VTSTDEADDAEEDVWGVCLQRVAQRDRQAFSRLFEHFAPLIKIYGLSTVIADRSGQFADELVQEVMITVWNKAGHYDIDKASASTWIFSIARNKRIDLLRKLRRQENSIDIGEIGLLEDEEAEPLQVLQKRISARRVRQALEALPAAQREVLLLAFVDELSHSEIAESLGLPLGTVKSRTRLALQRLQSILERQDFE